MQIANSVRLQQNLLVDPQRANLPIPRERPQEDHIFLHQLRQREQIGPSHHETLLPCAEELAQQQRRARRAYSGVTERRLDRLRVQRFFQCRDALRFGNVLPIVNRELAHKSVPRYQHRQRGCDAHDERPVGRQDRFPKLLNLRRPGDYRFTDGCFTRRQKRNCSQCKNQTASEHDFTSPPTAAGEAPP